MKTFTPTETVQHHANRLWEARLQVTEAPALDTSLPDIEFADDVDVPYDPAGEWPPVPHDPFEQAGAIAANLHGMLEVPQRGGRKSRALLHAMAITAMRKAP